MKKIIYLLLILTFAVFCSACINNYAVQQLNKKAKEYSDAGDLNTAVSRLESSVELDGNIFESRFNLAVAYFDVKKCDKAVVQILEAEKIKNNDAALYYVKGGIYNCLAENTFYKQGEDNEKIPITYDSTEKEIQKATESIEYLHEANLAYEKYIKIASNTDQNAQIVDIINSNNRQIDEYKSKYGI